MATPAELRRGIQETHTAFAGAIASILRGFCSGQLSTKAITKKMGECHVVVSAKSGKFDSYQISSVTENAMRSNQSE